MTFDVKKYPGYTEMLFKNRKSTLTRKKPLATFLTSDNLEVQLFDFYNKYYFFMKFDGFEPMVNIYDDPLFKAGYLDGVIAHYKKEYGFIDINDIEQKFIKTVTIKQENYLNPEYLEFCKEYIKRKGLDIPEIPEIKTECHLLGYDEDGRITYTPIEMEDENEIKEEQNEIAPLTVSETSLAVEYEEDEAFANLPPETNLAELKPIPLTSEDEAVFEPINKTQEVTTNFKTDKKPKKKSGKKKSKK